MKIEIFNKPFSLLRSICNICYFLLLAIKRGKRRENLAYQSYGRTQRSFWKTLLFGIVMMGIGGVLGGIISILVFIRITGGTHAPSGPISAPTLSIEMLDSPTNSVLLGDVTRTTTPSPLQLFRIVSEESEARFIVDETIPMGTAVGRTNQVAGDIIVDFNNPANSRIGTVRINLRTLQTDSADRDSSIRCCVLLSAQSAYEFADFVPTAITNVPSSVQGRETVTFQVTGDLTLKGVTRSVTFDVSLTIVNQEEIRGLARSTVTRSNFGILNNAENMLDYHGVSETVILEFEFVARPVQ